MSPEANELLAKLYKTGKHPAKNRKAAAELMDAGSRPTGFRSSKWRLLISGKGRSLMQLTIGEHLLYTTTRLKSYANGRHTGSGTGFFYHFSMDGDFVVPCLVTNKHVVQGADHIVAKCHIRKDASPSGDFIECNMDIRGGVFMHPDADVDLCAIPFGPIVQQANTQGTPIYYAALDDGLIPSDDDWSYFDAIEEVTMIGCPNGIFDDFNNLPIVRKGHTASALSKRYNGKNEFMVDMACFPGSSGSPIFLYNSNGYNDKKTNEYRIGASRVVLVGILYAGPQIANDGRLILAQPPRVSVASMMHLGNAIRSSELRSLHEEIKSSVKPVPIPPTDISKV